MNKTLLATALAAVLGMPGQSTAGALEDELAAIKARLNALEKQVQDQNAVIREKDRQIMELSENPALRGEGSSGGGWFQSVEIGGVVEIEAGYNDPDKGGASSDIVVATAEVGIAAQINDWTAAEITLLYEEEDTDLEVDVAVVTIANPDGPWFVTAGQQYVPFGTYETNLVSDPLTLEIGETRESAILAGVDMNGLVGGVYVYNGDLDQDGDDVISGYGVFGGYSRESENSSFAVNIGYISNIGDSDGLQDTINDNLAGADFDDQVGGVTVDAMFATGPFLFIAEYTTAIDSFTNTELAWGSGGAEPSAFNIEAGYNFTLAGKDATVAVGYQQTDEAVALGLPEERIAAAISVGIMENTTLSFEWAHDDDYSTAKGGDGSNGGDTITGQLAIEF